MDAAVREMVWQRAGERCEYCRLPQMAVDLTFHVEHIIARQHSGSDDPSNLCLSCDRCNLHKGPNLAAIDPASGQIVLLFHPRRDRWDEHFELVEASIVGRTATGRATAQLFQMNHVRRRELRGQLIAAGLYR
jgi:hypothetical protein